MTTTYIKQPQESRVYSINFRALLAKGDSILGVTALTAAPSGLSLDTPTVASPRVLFRVSGGSAGVAYKLTCRVQTADSDVLEGEGILEVTDL